MNYSRKEVDTIIEKIVELLTEKEEMRTGKIAKVLIHSGLAESSYDVEKIMKFKKDLFEEPKTGLWKLL